MLKEWRLKLSAIVFANLISCSVRSRFGFREGGPLIAGSGRPPQAGPPSPASEHGCAGAGERDEGR